MIRIEIDPDTKKELEEIHWKWFEARMNVIAWGKKSHKDFIFDNVEFLEANEKLLNQSQQEKIKNERLRNLIIGNPSSSDTSIKKFDFFKKINKTYHWHNVGLIKNNQQKTIAQVENDLIDNLQKAFGYEDFVSSPEKEQWYIDFKKKNGDEDWNIKVLSKKINIDVCPYCNRQYIFGYDVEEQEKKRKHVDKKIIRKNTAEIDHFYPKSHYPFFSCSLYNFVPSCHICNSIKQAQDKDILYPYTDSLDEQEEKVTRKNAEFTFKAKDGSALSYPIDKNTQKEIELKVDPNYSKKNQAESSKTMFHLNEIYSKHTLELDDIIDRYEKCTPKQLHSLYNFVTNNLKINISEENLKKLILGLPINTSKEYPLRKFKEDIINQINEMAKTTIK